MGAARSSPATPDRLVTLGRIVGLFGIRGWVKLISETARPDDILRYSPWYLDGQPWRPVTGKRHGKGLIAQLAGCDDRDAAATLVGRAIEVRRDQLPPPEADELYWADLEGLRVVTTEGVDLGIIDRLFETGANDVMVVRGDRERLIPFLWDRVVKRVDLDRREMRVDWEPDF
jgi:16S rRNA processing protein RimM